MKYFILVIILVITGCTHTPYVKVGAGYKVSETELRFDDGSSASSPISARIDIGMQKGNFTYGLSHHSQYFTGRPFNNDMEYQKTEVFVDYTYKFTKD